MKKSLTAFAILLLLSLNGLTQSLNNCDCPDQDDLKRVLIAAQKGKSAQEKVVILERNIAIYDERIKNLNDIIDTYKSKDAIYDSITQTYERELANLESQKKVLQDALAEQKAFYEKELKKEKRKRFWTTVAGITVFVATLFIK